MFARIAVLVFLLAVVVACTLKAPLGDPSQSKIDHRLDGIWMTQKDGAAEAEVALVAPFDEHSYVIVYSKVQNDGGSPRIVERPLVLRGWITDVAGSTFLTTQPVAHLVPSNGNKKAYIVNQFAFVDGALRLRPVNDEFKGIGNVTEAHEVQRLIAANIADASLFGEGASFRRLRTNDAFEAKLEKMLLEQW